MPIKQSSNPEFCDTVYKLFFAGNLPHSAKIKALLPKAGTRNLYFHNWKEAGKPNGYERKAGVGAKEGVVTGGGGTLTEPGGEKQAEQTERTKETEQTEETEEETEQTQEKQEEETQEKPKKPIEPAFEEAERETFPGLKVAGETLPFKVHLSVKTIALYEIAATEANDGLSLGKFLDTCARDYFLGRGVDLGLVELGGKQNG